MKNTGRRRAGSSRQVTGYQTDEGVAALLNWLAMLPGISNVWLRLKSDFINNTSSKNWDLAEATHMNVQNHYSFRGLRLKYRRISWFDAPVH